MRVTINGNELNVEVLGPPGAPVLIALMAAAGSARWPSRGRRSGRSPTGSVALLDRGPARLSPLNLATHGG